MLLAMLSGAVCVGAGVDFFSSTTVMGLSRGFVGFDTVAARFGCTVSLAGAVMGVLKGVDSAVLWAGVSNAGLATGRGVGAAGTLVTGTSLACSVTDCVCVTVSTWDVSLELLLGSNDNAT